MALHQDIDNLPVLIYRTPEIILFALYLDLHLVEIPFSSWLETTPTELIGIGLSKLEAPFPNRFVGNADTTIGHLLLDIPEAQRKGVMQPDAVADEPAGETVPHITGAQSLCVAWHGGRCQSG